MIRYLAKFRQGDNPMSMNAVDYYEDNGKIIKHSWAMGGETRKQVKAVPSKVEGYKNILDKE